MSKNCPQSISEQKGGWGGGGQQLCGAHLITCPSLTTQCQASRVGSSLLLLFLVHMVQHLIRQIIIISVVIHLSRAGIGHLFHDLRLSVRARRPSLVDPLGGIPPRDVGYLHFLVLLLR